MACCNDCKRVDLFDSEMQEIDGKMYCPACASQYFMKIETDNSKDMFFTKTGEDDHEPAGTERIRKNGRVATDVE